MSDGDGPPKLKRWEIPIVPRDFVLRICLVRESNLSKNEVKVIAPGKELSPSVWRRFRCSSHLTLDVFHDKVLAPVMGWTRNYHTFFLQSQSKQWLMYGGNAPDMVWLNSWFSEKTLAATKHPRESEVAELFGKKSSAVGSVAYYVYDLGDRWVHRIEVEEVLEGERAHGKVLVLGGEMSCPDDDGEGPEQYQKETLDCLMAAKRNPKKRVLREKYEKSCYGRKQGFNIMSWFDAEEFSVEEQQKSVNQALNSKGSTLIGTKIGGGVLAPANNHVYPGERIQTYQALLIKDAAGLPGSSKIAPIKMHDVVKLYPDEKDHTACYICGNPLKLKKCAGCQASWYCSIDCQKQDWRQHKTICAENNKNRLIAAKEMKKYPRNARLDMGKKLGKVTEDLELEKEIVLRVKRWRKSGLRFKVGDQVECSFDNGKFVAGEVTKIRYREKDWPKDDVYEMPYQVELENGIFIFAPWDNDLFIRRRMR